MSQPRIILVDDHTLFRQGLAELLEQRICPSVPLSNVHAVIGRVEQQDLPSVQREVEVRFAAGLRRACCAPAPDSP